MKRMNQTYRDVALILAVGVIAAYGLKHPTTTAGVLAITTGVLFLGGLLLSAIGRKRAPGSRWVLGWGVFQRGWHTDRPVAIHDALDDWRALGQREDTLLGAWECGDHCDARLFVGEIGGRRYYLHAGDTMMLWFRWALGYLIIWGKDPPLAAVPVGRGEPLSEFDVVVKGE